MTADPTALAALSNGERIEALRRRMASIPARTDGSAAPTVPVEQAEARFETRPETITESATNILQGRPGDRHTAPQKRTHTRERRLRRRHIIGPTESARIGDR